MGENKKANLTTLKCSNCGSSVFEQPSDDTYKCCYCGSILKDNNEEKQSFIKFLNSKSTKQSRIHIVNSLTSKDEFYKRAISYIGLTKNSPEDILTSKFEPVELRYGYYLIVNAEFKVATLSNTYFNDISYSQEKSKTISINSQIQSEEDVVSEYINVCSPLHDKCYEKQSEIFYKDVCGDYEPPRMTTVTSEQLKQDKISLPSKAKISEAIDRIINETKTELLQSRKESNVRIMHKINQIDLYVVPEYVLAYEYKNAKYEATSFAYDLNIMGVIPNDSENLYKQVMKKTAKYPIVSIAVSVLSAIFAFIHLTTLRLEGLVWIDVVLIPIMLLIFASTYFIDKLVTKRLLLQRYNTKKLKLKEFFENDNNQTLSADENEYINSFEGGC